MGTPSLSTLPHSIANRRSSIPALIISSKAVSVIDWLTEDKLFKYPFDDKKGISAEAESSVSCAWPISIIVKLSCLAK